MNKNEIIVELTALMELDFDAALSYEAAIEALDRKNEADMRDQFTINRNEKHNHVLNLSRLVRGMGGEPPERDLRSPRSFRTEGMARVDASAEARDVLEAMRTNEMLVNRRYGDALAGDWPDNIRDLLQKNTEDAQKHLAFIQTALDMSPITSR